MTEKLYIWGDHLEGYNSDMGSENSLSIEVKKLNFFIGKNNAGKSRFLRNLFISKDSVEDFNFVDLTDKFKELDNIVKSHNDEIWHGNARSATILENLNKILEVFCERSIYPRNTYKSEFYKISETLRPYRFNSGTELQDKIKEIFDYIDSNNSFSLFENRKYYIPTLRGLRPLSNQIELLPYIDRTKNDYFNKVTSFNNNNIITGEKLYNELKIHLLGEPEQRELIKNYEEKLSQYFFDNEPISLIPKHDQDVVNIKIGSDKQFPISQLGDGLQQAIILTYEAFIKKEETYAFFIEEPELHMHAGMVRQLMNFYLNETQHYYFFTTHSNHLLDMVDESNDVIIQKFVKIPNPTHQDKFDFKIFRCDRDHELLTSLGVRPSSVYLANCTIWVEGVTDRMYLSKLMQKYIKELESSTDTDDVAKAKKYKSFMPNFHYAFIEYAGGNITHWSFLDDYPTKEEAIEFLQNNKGLTAKAITQNILLLADGDNVGKAERLVEWKAELSADNVYILPCKEIENTLTPSIIYKACLIKFHGSKTASSLVRLDVNTLAKLKQNGYSRDTSKFDISKLTQSINFISNDGIGKIIDDRIRLSNIPDKDKSGNDLPLPRLFSDKSGTIDDKVSFCEICKDLMAYEDWQLTTQAKGLCEKIFTHIEKCNSN